MTEQDTTMGEQIERLTKEANRTTVLSVNGEPPGVYYLVGPDGKAQKQIAGPPRHGEKLATPAELAKFVEQHKQEGSAVFLDEHRVVFVHNLDDRRDVAECVLIPTPQYTWLKDSGGKQLNQFDLVRVLRIVFRGCLPEGSQLLPLLRALKFNVTNDAAASIQHQRESLGRSLLAEVGGEAALPEDVLLRIPVFENHPVQADVMCALELFPQEQKFRLSPYPMQLRRALDEVLADIELAFADDGPQVYRGQPQ